MSNEELCERIQAGESDLILELWEQVKKLVIKIIYKYLPKDGSTNRIEIDDLIQAGFIGMMGAVKDFKTSKELKFTSYLEFHLKNSAYEALGIRSEKQKKEPLHHAVSLDKPLPSSEDGSMTLADKMEDKSLTYVYDDIIDDLANHEDAQRILEEIKKLDHPDQDIFLEKNYIGLTAPEISEKRSMTPGKVKCSLDRSYHRIIQTKTVRLMSREREVDRQTNFYAGKGLKSFNTTFFSAVEDLAMLRERIRQRYGEEIYNNIYGR